MPGLGSWILSQTLSWISLPNAGLRLRKAIQQGIYYQTFRHLFAGFILRAGPGYFRYTEPFFRSSGMSGNGGNSCEYPFIKLTATSARKLPSWTAIL